MMGKFFLFVLFFIVGIVQFYDTVDPLVVAGCRNVFLKHKLLHLSEPSVTHSRKNVTQLRQRGCLCNCLSVSNTHTHTHILVA